MSDEEKNENKSNKRTRDLLSSASSTESVHSHAHKMLATGSVLTSGQSDNTAAAHPHLSQQYTAPDQNNGTLLEPVNINNNTAQHDQTVSNNMLLDELKQIRQGQEDIRKTFKIQIDELRHELSVMVEKKLDTIKGNIDTDLEKMQQAIAGIEARLTTVEQTPQAENVEGATDATASVTPATPKNVSKLIIKGLVYNPTAAEEAEDTLKASVLSCLQATGADIELEGVQHVERTRSGPDIKPIIVQLVSEEVKSTILRNKAKLREIEPYKSCIQKVIVVVRKD